MLPAVKVACLYQLENKMDAEIATQLVADRCQNIPDRNDLVSVRNHATDMIQARPRVGLQPDP